MVQALSTKPMINLRQSKTRITQVGEMGDNTTHGEGFGRIISQGGPQDVGKITSERTGRWMGVSTYGGSYVRGRVT